MYLTSFVHREKLFKLTERWLCGRLSPGDGLDITRILICDGFVLGEVLESVTKRLLSGIHEGPIRQQRIRFKGQLRDALCRASAYEADPRVRGLIRLYESNPDFYYREAPINGVLCLDERGRLLGVFRIKRPRRIAEKANRYIANWIFKMVQNRARRMAEDRAQRMGIQMDRLLTPEKEMLREFVDAEEAIARRFSEGDIELDRAAMTIHDVGGLKIIADAERLARVETILAEDPRVHVVDKENYWGDYRAVSLILEARWDRDDICRRYVAGRGWERYRNRGIPEEQLTRGLSSFIEEAEPTLRFELILSTFPDMVESELGDSIHEKRVIAQRDNKTFKGNIPMNVEFLIEYLFAVGFSPKVHVERLPIKLWGRYLPDTVIGCIRNLYSIPEDDLVQ